MVRAQGEQKEARAGRRKLFHGSKDCVESKRTNKSCHWENKGPQIPDSVRDWLRNIYWSAMYRNDFSRLLILTFILFAAELWPLRNLTGNVLMVPQPGEVGK
uniref:Uncharacterized protein n=1 Tax=Peromyscus maniculatus bairdii TaxID=230844 RepID=A0A8C8U9C2_PERMB